MADNKLIERLEELSNITLSGCEGEKLKDEIEKMLGYVGAVSACDLGDTEPLTHHFRIKNEMRADSVKASLSQSEALKNSDESENGYFTVPRAVGGKENE